MKRTIVHMPNTKLTVDIVLHRTLQKSDKLKSVIVIMQWDDDSMSVDWSSQQTRDMCMASKVLDRKIQNELYDD